MKDQSAIGKPAQFVASMGRIDWVLKLGVACLLLGVGSVQAVTSFNDFETDPNLAGTWIEYVYWSADRMTATWNSTDKDLDLVKSGGNGASGLYRTGTSRLPTDTVTMTVKSLDRSSGSWGFLALMITAVQQQDYLAGMGDSYSLVMTPVPPSSVKFAVRRTVADGTGDYQLIEGSEVAFAGPYTNQIIRVGDHYEFRSNGALLYSTAAPAAGDFYNPASKNSMVYYQIVMAGDGAMTATVDDFGVPPTSDPAVTVDGSTTVDSIAGNAPAGTLVGRLSMVNTDPAGFAYSLDPGGDTTHFEIPAGTSNLLVKAALGAGPYGLKIAGSNGGFAVTNDITITMLAHIGVVLSNTNMSANATVGAPVGTLSLVNTLTPGDFAFSLHASGDTTHFAIPTSTSNLVTDAPLSAGTYDIVLLATNATDGFWVTNGYTIAVAPVDPLPEPVQYWTFDDGSGSTAANVVTNGNTGTLGNTPTWITGGLASKLTSRTNRPSTAALDFDAGTSNDYVDGGNINLTSTGSGGAVTVSMWLRPDSLASPARLFNQSTAGGATSQQGSTEVPSDGRIAVWNGTTYVYPAPTAGTVAVGAWQHLALVWNSGKVTAWVDGVKKSTVTVRFDFGAANGNFGIAAKFLNTHGAGFDGQIDEVAIFDVALNQSQIVALANGDPAMPIPPPAGTVFRFR